MFTYKLPVYTPIADPYIPFMTSMSYPTNIPIVNDTTAKILTKAYENTGNLLNQTPPLSYYQYHMAMTNPLYGQALFPTSKPSVLSSVGLTANLYPENQPFVNAIPGRQLIPVQPFVGAIPGNVMYQNVLQKKCVSQNCKRPAVFGSSHCCDLCKISFGEAHTDICNKRNGQPTYLEDMINFGRVGEPYFEFTNFYDVPITIGDVQYKSSEHYFQTQKFTNNPDLVNAIKNAPTPYDAYVIGNNNIQLIVPDWESKKIGVMRNVMYTKFIQHPDLKEMLISTDNRRLVYRSGDKYWGVDQNGFGDNVFGKLLMDLRDNLKQTAQFGGDV